jgi:hypothetical protein
MSSKAAPRGCLAESKTVLSAIAALRANECDIDWIGDSAVTAKDGDTVVYRAIRKGGPGAPWLVMTFNSERIKWNP